MKNTFFFLALLFLVSCTSNTIYKQPKDLIPKDTMVPLIVDLYLASSAKNIKNLNLQKKINYMPLVYKKYQIDSLRFYESNLYYTSKYDEYESLIKEVKQQLVFIQTELNNQKRYNDSIRKDSINSKVIKLKKRDNNKKSK